MSTAQLSPAGECPLTARCAQQVAAMAQFQQGSVGPRLRRRPQKTAGAPRRAAPLILPRPPAVLAQSHSPSLNDLPFDVLVEVVNNIRSLADLRSLRATCRAWREALDDNNEDSLMSALCSRHFPGLGRLLRTLFGAERANGVGGRCPRLALVYVHCAPRAAAGSPPLRHVSLRFGPHNGLHYWGQVSSQGRPHGHGFMLVIPPRTHQRGHIAARRGTFLVAESSCGVHNTDSSSTTDIDDDSDNEDHDSHSSSSDNDSDDDARGCDSDDVAFQLANVNWYSGIGSLAEPTVVRLPLVDVAAPAAAAAAPASPTLGASAPPTSDVAAAQPADGDSPRLEGLPRKPLHHAAAWRVGDWLLGHWADGLLAKGLATCHSGSMSPCRSDWFDMYAMSKRVVCNVACAQAYYQGRVSQGRFHGRGAWIARHDSPCQPAHTLAKCGAHFTGKFVNGQPAFGRMEYEGGLTYVGEWRGGRFGGHGTLVRRDNNSKYTGKWELGREHGFGTRTVLNPALPGPWSAEARVAMVIDRQGAPVDLGPAIASYSGNWSHGSRHGSGTAIYTDGSHFRGMWSHGNRCGEGVEQRPDGSYYSGGWKGCVYHGYGSLRTADGHKRHGFWLSGQPCSAAVYREHARARPAASKPGRTFERMLDVPLGACDLLVKRLARPTL